MPTVTYERRRPEQTTLYQVVRENLATLYSAVDDGAIEITLPKFVRKELDGYLECGRLCRGFARLRCTGTCNETRLVALATSLGLLNLGGGFHRITQLLSMRQRAVV